MENDMKMTDDAAWLTELYLISHGATGASGRQEVIDAMLEHIVRGFGGVTGCLAVQPFSTGSGLVIVSVIDLPPDVVGRRISAGEGVLGRVLESGCPVVINGDIRADERFRDLPDGERRRPSSSVCWPLMINARVIGVLSINRNRGQRAFDTHDLERGESVVPPLAIVVDNWQMHCDLEDRLKKLSAMNDEIQAANSKLADAHQQLLQAEKMASIGQLAAGVAHEINNPVGYVSSNLQTLTGYVSELFTMIDRLTAQSDVATRVAHKEPDFEFLREDVGALLEESNQGLERVTKIVQDLKDFSRVEHTENWHEADLVACLNSTLSIVGNEIKYKAVVEKNLVPLPRVQCMASQINQVFLNLLVNASQAIDRDGLITLRCGHDSGPHGQDADGEVWFEFGDNGCGIAPENLNRIFDPFFTTKPVGRGTGLGLSLSYTIVKKHHWRLEVESKIGRGTCFRMVLPIRQSEFLPA
jgi:two-component system, NtrC family, sensor kinase